jgi:hypothetical protein
VQVQDASRQPNGPCYTDKSALTEMCDTLSHDVFHLKISSPSFMSSAIFQQPKLRQLCQLTISDVSKGEELCFPERDLTNVHTLQIRKWQSLQALPSSIGNLSNLKELSLCETSIDDLPDAITNLKLICLRLKACHRLKKVPVKVFDLTTLEALDLSDCSNLKDINEDIRNLTRLRVLKLNACSWISALPETISELQELIVLDLSECKHLRSLPKSILQLPELCKLSARGSGFCKTYNFSTTNEQDGSNFTGTLGQFKPRIRKHITIFGYLNDVSAYRTVVQHMSLISVLLATAAFVAFSQPPSQPEGYGILDMEPGFPTIWLRAFYIADQVTFVLSLAVVLLVQVSTLPFDVYKNECAQAARVWCSYVLLSLLLVSAVFSGIVAFFCAGVAVYPQEHVLTDLLPMAVLCLVLVVFIIIQWCTTIVRLYPSYEHCRMYLGMVLRSRCPCIKQCAPDCVSDTSTSEIQKRRRDMVLEEVHSQTL